MIARRTPRQRTIAACLASAEAELRDRLWQRSAPQPTPLNPVADMRAAILTRINEGA